MHQTMTKMDKEKHKHYVVNNLFNAKNILVSVSETKIRGF